MEWITTHEAYRIGIKFDWQYIMHKTSVFNNGNIAEKLGDYADPISCPPCPYPLVPGAGGRLVWITGYPGTGKSTAAQIMARNHGQNHNNPSKVDFNDIYFLGYVYFEGDCFWGLKNPYIPVNVSNPTMAKVVELQAVSTSQM